MGAVIISGLDLLSHGSSEVEYLIDRFPGGIGSGDDAANEAFLDAKGLDRWILIERSGRRALFIRAKQS